MEFPSFSFYPFFLSINNELESFYPFLSFILSKPRTHTFNLFSNLFSIAKVTRRDFLIFSLFPYHQQRIKIYSFNFFNSQHNSIEKSNKSRNVRHEQFHAFHDHWNETAIQWRCRDRIDRSTIEWHNIDHPTPPLSRKCSALFTRWPGFLRRYRFSIDRIISRLLQRRFS